MLLTLCVAFAQEALRPTGEAVLREIANVPLQAPRRNEGSIAKGAEPDLDSLYLPTAVTILRSGRVLASDWRDGSVHVFDERGARVALCVLPVPRPTHPLRLLGDRRGRVFIEMIHDWDPFEPIEYEFASDGSFLGQRPLPVGEDGSLAVIARMFSPLENGRFVVMDRYVPPMRSCFGPLPGPRWDPRQLLFVFDAEGDCVDQIDLPEQPLISCLAAGARRVVLSTFDDEWILVELGTRQRTSLRVPEQPDRLAKERSTWNVVARPDGPEELWVVEWKARRLIRYALPESAPK